jgi:hypothetical protein
MLFLIQVKEIMENFNDIKLPTGKYISPKSIIMAINGNHPTEEEEKQVQRFNTTIYNELESFFGSLVHKIFSA